MRAISDALKLLEFSDRVFLITTTTLKENEKTSITRMGKGKLKVLEGNEIEEIANYSF